ncbi:hypothetical protein GGP41_001984 [Bipolaris sorokiniana]|uniref:Uncharacterized protein n=1 Tax=Cochliobolus sativus TaxID=45130 RepID=A0A8H5ZQN9_COCSA|nr:hypothetical protein GGP41_001984 [Bipolaris sorokiniana]
MSEGIGLEIGKIFGELLGFGAYSNSHAVGGIAPTKVSGLDTTPSDVFDSLDQYTGCLVLTNPSHYLGSTPKRSNGVGDACSSVARCITMIRRKQAWVLTRRVKITPSSYAS